ncbi:TPA: hypothetical protein DDZ86_00285 [Candidatus Dependentiae bacterium]|nr:MAG: hypothetical protein UW09_C0002G0065 [candidate division TM6 bacterium GW2011_GWF2_43_87]HBL98066.1 hypothetical protein [Candidatus Dependentiae bacterium]
MGLKNHKSEGFTFIEVMAAMVVFAFLSVPLVRSQLAVLRRSGIAFMLVSSMIEMRNFCVELTRDAKFEKGEQFEKQVEYPPMRITVNVKKCAEQSALAVFPQGRIVAVEAEYELRSQPQKERLISFLVVKPPPKKVLTP